MASGEAPAQEASPAPLRCGFASGIAAAGAASGVPADAAASAVYAAANVLEAHGAPGEWAELNGPGLSAAVDAYRASIRQLAEQLAAAGQLCNADEDEEAPPAAQQPAGGAGAAGTSAQDGSTRGPDQNGSDPSAGALQDLDPREWQVPHHCIPIHADVTSYDWSRLCSTTRFDVIVMDPPWQLATANPTRGVALGYSQLTDGDIQALPIPQLQDAGFLFVWVINAKYKLTLDLFDRWGYKLVDEVVWVKMTVNRRLAKSHGYYLQHAKEVCLVGQRGAAPPGTKQSVCSDVIYSERRGQSQKPEEIYELVEQLVPNGRYLEIFARKNNLRDYWVSIGNEVTGKGLPQEDSGAARS